jgi:hypothetical protein
MRIFSAFSAFSAVQAFRKTLNRGERGKRGEQPGRLDAVPGTRRISAGYSIKKK